MFLRHKVVLGENLLWLKSRWTILNESIAFQGPINNETFIELILLNTC
jgi:hypothetical protein